MEIFLAMTYAGLRSLPFLFLIYYPFRHELRLPDWCVVAFTVVLALIDGMQCAGFVSINNLEPLLYAGQLSFAVLVIRTALCKKLFFICLSIFMERFLYRNSYFNRNLSCLSAFSHGDRRIFSFVMPDWAGYKSCIFSL